MFGYKIIIFKKNKGVKVDPVITEPKVDSEYEAWKKEQEKKKRDEIYAKNKELKFNLIKEHIESLERNFRLKFPQPFLVGEKVVYNFYGGYNRFSLGWFGSPGELYSTFKIEELNGPFKLPVHKIFVNSEWLYDKLDENVHMSWEKEETKHSINSQINNYLSRLS